MKSLAPLEGFDESAFTEAHREENKITSIRLNPFKTGNLPFKLDSPVAWCKGAYYLAERPFFTHDPFFHAGCYYVQEAGSMFIDYLLRQSVNFEQSLKVLDLCAAPGGKSTLLNSLISKDSVLVSNEIVKSRASVLVQNLSKWGTCNTLVTNNDPLAFSNTENFFDVIVVDAPCSGSGLFRKQPEAIDEWSPEAVISCSIRQKDILTNILPSLKDDGVLLYSTCSYSVEENERIVKWLVDTQPVDVVPVPVESDWGVVRSDWGYRFYPHLTKSEGFFCALLRKKDGGERLNRRSLKKQKAPEISKTEKDIITSFVDTEHMPIRKIGEHFHKLSPAAEDFLEMGKKNFYFKKAGVCLGEIKGKDFVPNQELAWTTELRSACLRLDLDLESAIKFLKKDGFVPTQKVQGMVLCCYDGLGLGWAKILPNRVNNYLPMELRILK